MLSFIDIFDVVISFSAACVPKFPLNYKLSLFSNCFMMCLTLDEIMVKLYRHFKATNSEGCFLIRNRAMYSDDWK